jgi:FKBP-type peptidyl-prolyl cis-trans isomerase 2
MIQEGEKLTLSIENLTKVVVTVRAGREEDIFDLVSSPVPFEFIFGVGTEGFCAFESALYEKSEGEKVTMTVAAGEAGEVFGHLHGRIRRILGIPKITESLFLEVTITGVSKTDNHELIQAIAAAAGRGGCGGSCDCGC